jgi:transposase
VKYGSAGKCRRKFRRKFRDERVPSRQKIHNLANKLRTTGLLIEKKQKHRRRVLAEEKLDDIGAKLEQTPRKSLKHLAQETQLPYKTRAIRARLPAEPCS